MSNVDCTDAEFVRFHSIWFCLMTSSCYMAFKVVCTAHKLHCTLFLMDFKIWNLKLLKLCDLHQMRNPNEGLIKYQTDESVWSPSVAFLLALLQCSFISFLNSSPPPTCSVRFSLSMAFPSVSRQANIGLLDTIRASVWH